MKIFLAFSFRDSDKTLVAIIADLLASHSILTITGEDLGGEQLTPAVEKRIDDCDGLIGLLTQRDKLAGDGWTTHEWVRDEIGYARSIKIKAIALVENGVSVGGMNQPNEFIVIDKNSPLAALVKLSRTIGEWKREAGRTVKVQILPSSIAKKLGGGSDLQCQHRLWTQGKRTDWCEVTPVPEAGGTFVYIPGIADEHLVELRIIDQNGIWKSDACSQWMQIKLSRGAK
jgi:hypothetical protein